MIITVALVFGVLGFVGGVIVGKRGYLDRVIDFNKFGL
jgi:multisubunit Na+/H+ antiporter MnhF subunit